MEICIYEKLIKAKNGDRYCLEEIIKIFDPLISKYSRLLDGEDTKQALSLHLLIVVNKIPVEYDYLKKDKIIVGYI
ncbi:helix-turn-helix domain-containing protein [Clostridium sp. HCS.1]|uniref:helix-turn-helix domain-containing protein n=1 Tax=Clostridium sp. HCS.1 TaxID=3238594 RepID=UPI003A1014A7